MDWLPISNNLVSQAGQLDSHGAPNDLIRVFNGAACVLCGPIIQNGLYPLLRKYKIHFRPMARITAAFLVMAVSMTYATIIQKLIYSSGPCYEYPLECEASMNGKIHNSIFGFVTALEYSYSKAPKEMKPFLQAFAQLMSGIGAALGIALSPAARNPYLIWLYTALAAVMGVSALGFWLFFRHYDDIYEELERKEALNGDGTPTPK
ncbi:oligopeptide transporter [Nemania sp. NC0429]|nr:oligopeptide transporter [Nemania sp. NC0429]